MEQPSQFDSRRASIVAETARLFDESGFTQVSMDDIGTNVGLRKPSLYHYFESKDEILFLIHEEFMRLLISRHEARLGTDLSPSQRLLAAMVDIVELMHTHRGHVRVFFEHHRELPDQYHKRIEERRDTYFNMISSVIEEAVADGEIDTPNVQLTTLAVFGMCNWAYTWYRPDGPMLPAAIARHFWNLLMHGVAAVSGR